MSTMQSMCDLGSLNTVKHQQRETCDLFLSVFPDSLFQVLTTWRFSTIHSYIKELKHQVQLYLLCCVLVLLSSVFSPVMSKMSLANENPTVTTTDNVLVQQRVDKHIQAYLLLCSWLLSSWVCFPCHWSVHLVLLTWFMLVNIFRECLLKQRHTARQALL